ncbi:MAG: TspO/MBR family protein [Pseudomonadota bacterium]
MALAVFFVLVFVAASSGAIFKPDTWYEGLAKPWFTPPNWVFPVVWAILYVGIAFAGWLVWRETGFGVAVALWGAQLVLNAVWSGLFFGMRRMDLAFAEVCTLMASVLAFIVAAWPVSPLAALLFVPYALWVGIAAALNLSVWRMNPDAMRSSAG